MAIDREAIFQALTERIKLIPDFRLVDRKLRAWGDVSPAEQPCCFITVGNSIPKQRRGLQPQWTLQAVLYVYCRNGDEHHISPGQRLNEFIKAVEVALERKSNEELDQLPAFNDESNMWGTTLGGLVSHCWISGNIETDEGTLGDQAVAIIQIDMLTL